MPPQQQERAKALLRANISVPACVAPYRLMAGKNRPGVARVWHAEGAVARG